MNALTCNDHPRADGVKARLLPLSPAQAAMERFIEHLPRRQIEAKLTPLDGITIVDESKGEYKSTGTSPCFVLSFGGSEVAGGWYYIEAALVRHNGSRVANLRVEMADESDRQFDWPVTTNLRGSIREVIYLPPDAKRFLWFPTGAPGFFSQSPLLVHQISRAESAARRLHRVIDPASKYRRDSAADPAKFGIWATLLNLQRVYRQTADWRAARFIGEDYPRWLAQSEKRDRVEAEQMLKQATALTDSPLISLFMVLRSPTRVHLEKTLESVVSQLYTRWELHVSAGADVEPGIVELLKHRQLTDSRIKLTGLSGRSSGTSVARRLNQAMQMAEGKYGARLGQHDLIHPLALTRVVILLAKLPSTDLVYTDDDQINEIGERSNPAFKPDWNPDLLLSYNYVGGLVVYRKTLAANLGGYRPEFEASEDYDLMLRMSRIVQPEHIVHIPKVLYSHRLERLDAKSLGDIGSGLRALQAHLAPAGATASAGGSNLVFRVQHPLPALLPLVTLIIPTRDKVEILKKCVESIQQKTDYANWEMIVVDNRSNESATRCYLLELEQDPRIRVMPYDRPFNYSAINNFAALAAKGDVLGLLNNDLEVLTPSWLSEMVCHALRPEIGAVGAKLLYPDGTVQHAGVILGVGGVAGHVHRFLPGDDPGYCDRASVTQNLSAVTGACLLVRKSLYWEVGGLNEAHLAVAFNDIDFCLKLRQAGYRNLFTPHALLIHHESISRGRDDTEEKNQLFKQEYAYMQNTWREKLRDDPAYNVNLTLEFENYTFAAPA